MLSVVKNGIWIYATYKELIIYKCIYDITYPSVKKIVFNLICR